MIREAARYALARVKTRNHNSDSELRKALMLLLEISDPDETVLLRETACTVRNESSGARMAVRALVETSSLCNNDCYYCGLNRGNKKAHRYKLGREDIVCCAKDAFSHGIRTVVLQSGEDGTHAGEVADTIADIKKIGDIAVTLSFGERPRHEYALWKEAGADRYLLRIESTDPNLYASMHRNRKLESRLECLDALQELGYQTGSGIMIGFPGQTAGHIADDLIFFTKRGFEMIGMGPFIPHPDTPFARAPSGSVRTTLNAIAAARLCMPNVWMPATTALGSMDKDWRPDALRSGANVLMPNFSPQEKRKLYSIYPGKRCIGERTALVQQECESIARAGGLTVDWSRADAPAFAVTLGKASSAGPA